MNDNSGMMIGSAAVDFTLPASTGGEIALSDYRTRQNVYLFFVRAFN